MNKKNLTERDIRTKFLTPAVKLQTALIERDDAEVFASNQVMSCAD
jgi:hypothetical protein